MNISKIWKILDGYIDFDAMWRRAVNFYEYEKRMGFKSWRASAEYGAEEFKKLGLDVEKLEAPADGKTAFLDHIMPMGWDCDFAKVEIIDENGNTDLLVDSASKPLCIGPFSPPTPPEGIVAEVVGEFSYGKTPWKGKFIFSSNQPSPLLRKRINSSNALGLLCAWNDIPLDAPDSHQFLNSFSSGPGWYPTADEPPEILFSLSPREGKRLTDLMAKKRTRVKVTVDGKLGEDKFLTVSAALPGEIPESAETLAIAHIYEPFPCDDAMGAAGAVEILAAIKKAVAKGDLPCPKRSIRSLLMWEQYGLSHFFEKSIGKRRSFLTAVSLDAPLGNFDYSNLYKQNLAFNHSSAALPWGGDFQWLDLVHKVFNDGFASQYCYSDIRGYYGDDCILNNPAFGTPTLWFNGSSKLYHHNTELTWDKIDTKLYPFVIGSSAAYLYAMAFAGENEGRAWTKNIIKAARDTINPILDSGDIERAQFEADYYAGCVESLMRLEDAPSKTYVRYLEDNSAVIKKLVPENKAKPLLPAAFRQAEDWIVKLADPGILPYDQPRLSPAERLPGSRAGNVRGVLNWCGKNRNLAEAVKLRELERKKAFNDAEIRQIMRDLRKLAKAGYVEITEFTHVDEKDFLDGLRQIGIAGGDTLFVHSSLSSFGKVDGGPATVINALKTTVGENGLIAMPVYTDQCIYDLGDGSPYIENPVPFDPKSSEANTGAVANSFWKQEGVLRGSNPVHSTAAWGQRATEFLKGDDENTPCCSLAGPLGNILLRDGKFLFLGAGMYYCTFLHAMEDACDLPYLTNGLALSAEGKVIRRIPMPLFPAGPREFYKKPDNECFQKLHRHGLKKEIVKVGLGEIEVVSARNLALASLKMLADDPLAMIADGPFYPISEFSKEAESKVHRIRGLLKLAEADQWSKFIETAAVKK